MATNLKELQQTSLYGKCEMDHNACFFHDFDSFHKCQNLDTCYNGTFFHDIEPLCCSLYTKHYCRPRSWAVLQTMRPCCRRTMSTYMTNDKVSCICLGPYRSKIRSIEKIIIQLMLYNSLNEIDLVFLTL